MAALSRALRFAAEAHANQRRKGAAQEPYINHLIEVMDLVACATGGDDVELLQAALLHDVVEDTPTTPKALADSFGPRVATMVHANSDDMSLPKEERKRARLAAMATKSREARLVKIADVTSNLRAVACSPPAGWTPERRLSYLADCRALVAAATGTDAALEQCFAETAASAERMIRGEGPLIIDGQEEALHALEAAIGQPIFHIHMANTACAPIGETEMDRFCNELSRQFPSVIVQRHEAIYDGQRRPILSARLRTDSPSAVVAMAQRLCIVFEQRFVGVELDGRYVRVYADDTG
ncbi:MAG: HD domain-containing protein [Pseudomonadota bacterium]